MYRQMIESDLTFRAPLTIAKLELLGNALPPARLPDTMVLVYANRSTDAPTTVNVSALATAETLTLSLDAGGWFAVLSPADSAAHLWFASGASVRVVRSCHAHPSSKSVSKAVADRR